MFDWPVATVVLGIMGTITVAIIKLVRQRVVVENGHGEKCASKEDVKSVWQAVAEHQKYAEMRNHDIINLINSNGTETRERLEPIKDAVLLLLERSRRHRANNDQDD